MHPDLEAIAAADLAARHDVDATRQRLAAREATERARLEAERDAEDVAARARLDADIP